MGIRFQLILFALMVLAACSSPTDDIEPALNFLGDDKRIIHQKSVVLEGELQDNQQIASFTYRLNSGEPKNVLDALGQKLYRFTVTDLQEGKNTIELSASDISGNTSSQTLIIQVIAGFSDNWHQDVSYTVCGATHQTTLSLTLSHSENSVTGSATLEFSEQTFEGHLSGYKNDQTIQGALSLSDDLGTPLLGQFSLSLDNDKLSGTAIFKKAIPCSSTHSDDLNLVVELGRR
jgi:hypothetical protein